MTMKDPHERPSQNGKTRDGREYLIHAIGDRDHHFMLDFQCGSRSNSVPFARRPPEREQMEYAHACVKQYLDGDLQSGETAQ